MLVLTRKAGEIITIGNDIRLHIVRVTSGRVTIGIEAPRELHIAREDAPTIPETYDDPLPEPHDEGERAMLGYPKTPTPQIRTRTRRRAAHGLVAVGALDTTPESGDDPRAVLGEAVAFLTAARHHALADHLGTAAAERLTAAAKAFELIGAEALADQVRDALTKREVLGESAITSVLERAVHDAGETIARALAVYASRTGQAPSAARPVIQRHVAATG